MRLSTANRKRRRRLEALDRYRAMTLPMGRGAKRRIGRLQRAASAIITVYPQTLWPNGFCLTGRLISERPGTPIYTDDLPLAEAEMQQDTAMWFELFKVASS